MSPNPSISPNPKARIYGQRFKKSYSIFQLIACEICQVVYMPDQNVCNSCVAYHYYQLCPQCEFYRPHYFIKEQTSICGYCTGECQAPAWEAHYRQDQNESQE